MSGIDYKALFSQVLYEEMGRIFAEHHIDIITEDELEDIVAECYRKVYWQSIAEFRRLTGESPIGRQLEFRLSPPKLVRLGKGGHV